MSPLDSDEQALLASVELGEWRSIAGLPQEVKQYQRYAQSQSSLETVSVQLPASDMEVLQTLAQQTGTSVSLLVGSVLHQYVTSQSSQS